MSKRARVVEVVSLSVPTLRQRIISNGDPLRKEKDRSYLKMDAMRPPPTNYGCTNPTINTLVKEWCKGCHVDGVVGAAREMWQGNEFDMRMACVKMLRSAAKSLPASFLEDLEGFLATAQTWALIDELSMHVAPQVIAKQADPVAVLDRWAKDDNVWVRRSSLLAHSVDLKAGKGDFERFDRLATGMLEDSSFWIRKAIGWVLRDVSHKRHALVTEFLTAHPNVSGVTWKEAIKYLPAADVQRLTSLRNAQ